MLPDLPHTLPCSKREPEGVSSLTSPSLARNASRRGSLYPCLLHHTLPRLKRESEGVSSLPLLTMPPCPSLARNASRRGLCFFFYLLWYYMGLRRVSDASWVPFFLLGNQKGPRRVSDASWAFFSYLGTRKARDAFLTRLGPFSVTWVPQGPETRC